MCAGPGGGEVDLASWVDGFKRCGKVFGQDGGGVVSFEEGEGGGEADYAGAFVGHMMLDIIGTLNECLKFLLNLPDYDDMSLAFGRHIDARVLWTRGIVRC